MPLVWQSRGRTVAFSFDDAAADGDRGRHLVWRSEPCCGDPRLRGGGDRPHDGEVLEWIDGSGIHTIGHDEEISTDLWKRIVREKADADIWLVGTVRMEGGDPTDDRPHVILTGLQFSTIDINLPVVAVTVPLALRFLSETRAERPERLDIGGAALIAGALFLLVLPLVEGRQQGWPVWSWAMLAAAPVMMAWFWHHERRLADRGGSPLVVPALLAVPGLKRGLVAALFFYALAAFWLFFSVYEQSSRGRTAFETGVDILPAAVGFLVGPFISAPIGRRLGGWTAPLGMVLQAAGLLGTAAAILSAAPSWLPGPLLAIGFGQVLALPALTREITTRAPQRRAGLAAGLVSSMFQIGGALSVALIGGLFYSLLGADGTGARLALGYAAGVTCIAACLLVAAWLVVGVSGSTRRRRQAGEAG